MIGRVHKRGTNLAGLLRYLYGPGRHEEHVRPRLVAAWADAGDVAALEPGAGRADRRDFNRLVSVLEAPMQALSGRAPARPVWHCSLRLAPGDPVLDDATWTRIATEFMGAMGLDGPGGVHWVAVRHADDHIHLAAILARTDGRPERASFDGLRSREACRAIEARYGLTVTAPADRTAARAASSAEQRKAARLGQADTPRGRLLREVRAAAAGAVDEQAFLAALADRGLRIRLRYSTRTPGEVTGYAVAEAGVGEPVYFSGGKLAADLSLPRLRARWASGSTAPGPHTIGLDPYLLAAEAVRGAAAHLRRQGRHGADVAATAAAAADLLTVVAWRLDGAAGGPATSAARLLDRAARDVDGRPGRRSPVVGQLRGMARRIGRSARLVDDRTLALALQLMADLAVLAETLADLRAAQRREHQAAAGRLAASQLRALAAGAPGRPPAPFTLTRPHTARPGPVPAAMRTPDPTRPAHRAQR